MLKGLLFVVVGLISILIGCFNKKFYYAKSLQAAVISDKPAPLWFGRGMFLLVGAVFVLFGLRQLLF
jgi:hypothetical protein